MEPQELSKREGMQPSEEFQQIPNLPREWGVTLLEQQLKLQIV